MKRSVVFRLFAALSILTAASAQHPAATPAMLELADAERAFARNSVEKGMPLAFYEWFAEDGIAFNPAPSRYREEYRKQPPPQGPPPFRLDWWPVFGDIAASGELGYTTGPYEVTDLSPEKRAPRYGFYFSVWRKQADGAWRVQVDMGIQTPKPEPLPSRGAFVQAGGWRAPLVADRETAPGRDALFAGEAEFFAAYRRGGLSAAYAAILAEECRVHRNGIFPILGRNAALSFLEGKEVRLTAWEPLDGAVAASGNLGYTYGRYVVKTKKDGQDVAAPFYFTRVWKRDRNSAWKVVADVNGPALPQ
jgi:ketosteroid isomerase-like protein